MSSEAINYWELLRELDAYALKLGLQIKPKRGYVAIYLINEDIEQSPSFGICNNLGEIRQFLKGFEAGIDSVGKKNQEAEEKSSEN